MSKSHKFVRFLGNQQIHTYFSPPKLHILRPFSRLDTYLFVFIIDRWNISKTNISYSYQGFSAKNQLILFFLSQRDQRCRIYLLSQWDQRLLNVCRYEIYNLWNRIRLRFEWACLYTMSWKPNMVTISSGYNMTSTSTSKIKWTTARNVSLSQFAFEPSMTFLLNL